MPNLARTLLAPVLLVQGKRMFKTMPKLTAPSGAREGTRGTGDPLRFLLVGDSSAEGYGAETQDDALLGHVVSRLAETHRVTWTLFARFGSTVPRTLAFLRKQEPEPFDVALLAIGMNDVIAGQPLPAWLASYRELVAELRERFGVGHVVVSGMPLIGQFPAVPQPMRWVLGRQARRYDAALEAWAEGERGVTYIGLGFAADGALREGEVTVAEVMAADGFHPGPRVYDEWARRAAEQIRALQQTRQ
ncbi:MAG: SGNH/GDSL hydrolase family protein [Bacteroidota bacterium]